MPQHHEYASDDPQKISIVTQNGPAFLDLIFVT
jgi:hypothetical protein